MSAHNTLGIFANTAFRSRVLRLFGQGCTFKKLCPVIHINGEKLVLLTNQMTTIPKSILKTEVISLESFRYEIIDAIDFLITGI